VRLTAENTAIVLDSTADFPEGPSRFASWRVVPLYVSFGSESFRDYVELGPEEFYARLRASDVLPTTSQPTPGDFLAVFQELAEAGYERILSLQVAAKLSGTLDSARTAAAALDGRVRAIDSGTASAAVALLALAIQRRLERGTDDGEVDELVARYKREARLLFTVDTLEFLAKGGRIGRARALAGQLLHVKPILTISDGEVVPIKRVRGNQKAFQEFATAFQEGTGDEPGWRVGVAHGAAPERLEALMRLVRDRRPQAEIEVATTLGAVVGTHAGPGTVGLFWFHDPVES
jgi:DegV family protein with EDD domain